jgi:hypothetical protein
MTVKELIIALSALPSDATVTYTNSRFIVDGVDYDNYDNTITFIGDREFGIDYEDDIPDDVDETNYDPYCGCDMFEICGSIDEEW